jgi:hypothetical protein
LIEAIYVYESNGNLLIVVEDSSSFAASAGCFHLWWYPTLLGAHQVPQKRTCVCLFFPPVVLLTWAELSEQSVKPIGDS